MSAAARSAWARSARGILPRWWATWRMRTCRCARRHAWRWDAWASTRRPRCSSSGSGTGRAPERAAAAQGLARLSSEALGELETCLEPGASEPVVVEALGILARTSVPRLEPRVLQLAESPSPGVRLAALRAVVRGCPARGPRSHSSAALADRHTPIQAEALELLVRRGGEKSVATLVAMLGTADSLRFHVIRALGQCRAQAAAARLRELFPECGPHEQLQIVSSLIRIAPAWLPEFLLGAAGIARSRHAPRRRPGPRRDRGLRARAGAARPGGRSRLGHPPLRRARPRQAADGGDAATCCSRSRATWSRWWRPRPGPRWSSRRPPLGAA